MLPSGERERRERGGKRERGEGEKRGGKSGREREGGRGRGGEGGGAVRSGAAALAREEHQLAALRVERVGGKMEHEQPETHGTEEQRHDGWRGRRPEPSANECVLNGSAEGDIECGVDFHVSSLDGDNANTLVTGGTQGVAVSLREGFRHQRERPSSSAFRNLRSNSPHALSLIHI